MLMLKQIRNDQKLSVPKLSAISGVPVRTIQDIEARNDCRISTAAKIAKALGVTLDDLWHDETVK